MQLRKFVFKKYENMGYIIYYIRPGLINPSWTMYKLDISRSTHKYANKTNTSINIALAQRTLDLKYFYWYTIAFKSKWRFHFHYQFIISKCEYRQKDIFHTQTLHHQLPSCLIFSAVIHFSRRSFVQISALRPRATFQLRKKTVF